MVSALPHQGRQLGVTGGGHEILLLNAFRCHAGEVRDTLARIEHRHLVIDELHGVPVPRDEQGLEPLSGRPGGQGGENVIGLVVLLGQMNDVEGVEDLLDEIDLAGEFRRSGGSSRLVLGVLSSSEGTTGKVPRHRDVRGLLITQQVDEHGDKTVHRIGVLARRGDEVLHRQGIESPEGHGMPIEDHEGGLRRLAHVLDFRGHRGQS